MTDRATAIDTFNWDAFGEAVQSLNPIEGAGSIAGTDQSDLITGADAEPGARFDYANTIAAEGGDDFVQSGAGGDNVNGGDGNDTLYGSSGNDYLKGDDGDDSLSGGNGQDRLEGGNGNDKLYGGDQNDSLSGSTGDDVLHGGDGDDFINGDVGSDTLKGGEGDDHMRGGQGQDRLEGGNGNDILFGGDQDDSMSGNSGNDVLHGGSGDDFMNGGTGSDTLYGGEGDDLMMSYDNTQTPHEGGNQAFGEGGNDQYITSNGEHYFDGGAGEDKIEVTFSQGDVQESAQLDGFFSISSEAQTISFQNVELIKFENTDWMDVEEYFDTQSTPLSEAVTGEAANTVLNVDGSITVDSTFYDATFDTEFEMQGGAVQFDSNEIDGMV